MENGLVNEPTNILDSRLISPTLEIKNYNVKLVDCNEYIQVYFYKKKKIKKNIVKDFDLNLKKLNIDTDLNNNTNNFDNELKKIEERNIIRSKLSCQRLAKANMKDWETFITLTFEKNINSIRNFSISFLMQHRINKLKKYYIKKYGYFDINYYIFGGKKPLSTTTIDRHKKNACEKAKLPNITQHEFRHSCASRLLRKNVPIDCISKLLGHSSVSMTLDVYCHNEKRMHRTLLSKLFF